MDVKNERCECSHNVHRSLMFINGLMNVHFCDVHVNENERSSFIYIHNNYFKRSFTVTKVNVNVHLLLCLYNLKNNFNFINI